MTFEVGAVLEDPHWQAPVYCFDKKKDMKVDSKYGSKFDGGYMDPQLDGILRGPMAI